MTDKEKIKSEIESLKKHYLDREEYDLGYNKALEHIASFIDSLPEECVNTWEKQNESDIYDAVKGWRLYRFVCIMKDGTIQFFNGMNDETADGHINTHVDGLNDDYNDVDDIIAWIEVPYFKNN